MSDFEMKATLQQSHSQKVLHNKTPISLKRKNKDVNFTDTNGMTEAVRYRIFIVRWSNRKRICRLPKMANSRSEGVRR